MNLSSEDLFDILTRRVSEDTPHADYDRTVEVAKWCKQIITGEDQKEILISYKSKETQAQIDQRVKITNSRTQYVSNKVKKLFNEVHRCDDVVESISYGDSDQSKVTDLVKALEVFFENKPLKKYIANRFKDLVFEDPNAYIVIEFENNDPVNKKPTVYPYEVRASEVYDPHYVNGVLQHLITFYPVEYLTSKGTKVTGNRYTMYATGFSWDLKHIPDEVDFTVPEGWTEFKLKIGVKEGEQRVIARLYETKTIECPAFRTGYMDDPDTNGRTKVNPMYPAKHILTDLIWNKSEYDLSKALHGFYQKYVWVHKCKPCHGDGTIEDREREGRFLECPSCKGTGKNIQASSQDIVELTFPDDDPSKVFDLSKLVYYTQIPEGLITKQREDYISDQKDVFNCIFGANVLERSELVETATAKNYDWRAVNNTLFEYADHVSDFFKHAVRLTANHRDEEKGLIVQHSHPYDFKLESVQDLIDQRSSAVTAGTPMAVISAFDLAILGKQHKDDPNYLKRYNARERFRPMRDKTKEERLMMFSVLPNDDPERVLHIYYERIMDDIFDEHQHFADMTYKKQRAIVYAMVDGIIQAKALQRPTMSRMLSSASGEEE